MIHVDEIDHAIFYLNQVVKIIAFSYKQFQKYNSHTLLLVAKCCTILQKYQVSLNILKSALYFA